MKSFGIIAEYNPFHNGHKYQIEKIKEMEKDSIIICVLSGHFTQRGDVSIIDKFKRAKEALDAGCNLVVELPFPFATQSADYFAYGGVTILEKLKVQNLVFGSESNDLEKVKKIVDAQINNKNFNTLVNIYNKMGNNYPTSLSLALKDITNEKIDAPNDLLGISYIKAIKENNYKISPITIKRTNNYHGKELENIASGMAIREALKNNIDIKNQVPDFTLKDLNNLHFIEDYFTLLKYKIISDKDLSIYQTVDEGIDKLMKKVITKSNNLEELIKNLKSKRYTYNKITRMLLHILCNFTKEDAKELNKITYIRPLAFDDIGKKYLHKIKKDITVPIISKINRTKNKMLEYELETTKIYDLIKSDNLYDKEFKNNPYKKSGN